MQYYVILYLWICICEFYARKPVAFRVFCNLVAWFFNMIRPTGVGVYVKVTCLMPLKKREPKNHGEFIQV